MKKRLLYFLLLLAFLSNFFFVYDKLKSRNRLIELKKQNKILVINSQSFGIKVSNYFCELRLNRHNIINILPINYNSLVFLGDSFLEYAEISELFHNNEFKNRGVAGETTSEIKIRLKEILTHKPKGIIIQGGTNDILKEIPNTFTLKNFNEIIKEIRKESPKTLIYIQEIPPKVNPLFNKKSEDINIKLKEICKQNNVILINLTDSFNNKDGNINKQFFSNDGIHFNGQGYLKWKEVTQKYIIN